MADRIKVDARLAQAIREVNQGQRRTNRVVDATYGNVYRAINQAGNTLTVKNARILGQMKQLLARRAALEAVGSAKAGADAAYGGMSDYTAQAFQPATAAAKGGQAVEQAQVKEGQKSAATSQGLVSIARAGARQAEAGAHYAVALEAAQQRHDITMAELQQQFQLEQMDHQADLQKKQFQWQQKQAQAQLGQQEYATAVQLGSGLTSGFGAIHAYLLQNPGAQPQDVVDSLKQDGVVTAGQEPVWLQLVRDLQGGMHRDQALADVLTTFYPDLTADKKTYSRVLAYIRSQIDALDASRAAAAARTAETAGDVAGPAGPLQPPGVPGFVPKPVPGWGQSPAPGW